MFSYKKIQSFLLLFIIFCSFTLSILSQEDTQGGASNTAKDGFEMSKEQADFQRLVIQRVMEKASTKCQGELQLASTSGDNDALSPACSEEINSIAAQVQQEIYGQLNPGETPPDFTAEEESQSIFMTVIVVLLFVILLIGGLAYVSFSIENMKKEKFGEKKERNKKLGKKKLEKLRKKKKL